MPLFVTPMTRSSNTHVSAVAEVSSAEPCATCPDTSKNSFVCVPSSFSA